MSANAALSPLKRALLKLDELERELAAAREPLAIVGIGCRMPGGVRGHDGLWRLLLEGRDAIVEVPPDRWAVDDYYDPRPGVPGKMVTRWGGFIDEVDRFDPQFFGISPREAASLDPQQRLLLEVAWEALEDAALAPDRLAGSKTGVFVGLCKSDYMQRLLQCGDGGLDAYFASGNAHSVASGRISYLLGLNGPSVTVDTACSSSLTAAHLACQSLRTGDSDLAIVGGVNLILAPASTIAFSRASMLSAAGRCKTFDASADGFVQGEGCGVAVLKRLADARCDGDPIHAVIRGTAINQDGASAGLTAPSGPAQEAVIRAALQNAGVAAAAVGYVEAHGTGTRLGDPIEVQALAAVLGAGRAAGRPLVIGSLKTNFGHLEAAAGIAGLIKAALVVEHGRIPRHLHCATPNPFIAWEELPVRVATECAEFPAPRLAGVSSFGFSGTNVHLILEQPPSAVAPAGENGAGNAPNASECAVANVFTLSAPCEAGLNELARRHAADSGPLADLCHTVHRGRAEFNRRLAVLAAGDAQLRDGLAAAAEGLEAAGIVRGSVTADARPKVAFLFPGQGTGWPGMGRALAERAPVFRSELERCAQIARPLLDEDLLDVVRGDAGDLSRTLHAQPALLAVGWALAAQWRAWGVAPAACLGHSLGEITAACVSGMLAIEEGLRLACARGRAMEACPAGRMVSLCAAEETVRAALESANPGVVDIAAINAPGRVVVSGEPAAIEQLITALGGRDVRPTELRVARAFHSPLIEPSLAAIAAAARPLQAQPPHNTLVSNLTGQPIDAASLPDADAWARHARRPVLFAAGARTLQEFGCRVFVEMGPGSVLLGLVKSTIGEGGLFLPSLRRNAGEWEQIVESLGRLWVAGGQVDWDAFDRPLRPVRRRLPTYPFQRERYWTEPPPPQAQPECLGLLGRRVPVALGEIVFETSLGADAPAWLADHVIHGSAVLPLTAALAIAAQAAREGLAVAAPAVTNLVIHEPFVVPPSGAEAARVQTVVSRDDDRSARVRFFSLSDNAWRLHFEATVAPAAFGAPVPSASDPSDLVPVAPAEFYAGLRERGLQYGPAFQGLAELRRADGEAVGVARLNAVDNAAQYILHPALLDACVQALAAAVPGFDPAGAGDIYMPLGLDSFEVDAAAAWGGANALAVHARLAPPLAGATGGLPQTVKADVELLDSAGRPVGRLAGLHLKRAPAASFARAADDHSFYEIEWRPAPAAVAAPAPAAARWLILAAGGGVGARLAEELNRRGQAARLVAGAAAPDFPIDGDPPAAVVDLRPLDAPVSDPAGLNACVGLLRLANSLAGHARLWVVTRGAQPASAASADPAQAALWGLARTIDIERPELRCARVDLDPAADPDEARWLADELLSGAEEPEVASRDGRRLVARLARAHLAEPAGPVRLVSTTPGSFDGVRLAPLPAREPGPGEVRLQVRAAGLNFRDVLNVLALREDPEPLGSECAGVVTAVGAGVGAFRPGDAVIAIAEGCFASEAIAPAVRVWRKPAGIDFAEAATLPLAMLTAHQALFVAGRLQPGQTVLVHAAAGGVGMAAVALARRMGARVIATAGNPAKRACVQSLGVERVFDSRSASFAAGVREATGGRGVDVVLNCLTGDLIRAGLELLVPGGRFVEIGKAEILTPDAAAAINPGATYHPIDLSMALRDEPGRMAAVLAEILDRVASGELQPLPLRSFGLSSAAAALRHMAAARHVGKIVLVPLLEFSRAAWRAPRSAFLVTGGLGALGLIAARWLAGQGARNIALMGRGEPSAEAEQTIAELERAGARVKVFRTDVTAPDALRGAIEAIDAELGPLRGIVHAAGAIEDAVLGRQGPESFRRVMAPKALGAWNLYRLTRDRALDCFVMYSSLASILGSAGQANYAAANAWMDGFAHWLRGRGIPALSVNWGVWDGVGMAARSAADGRARGRGVDPFAPAAGVRALGRLIESNRAQAAFAPLRRREFLASLPGAAAPLFEDFKSDAAQRPASSAPPKPADARAAFEAAAPERRRPLLAAHVRELAARVLNLDAARMDDDARPLQELGLDSLMAVELRNLLAASLGAPALPATLAFDYASVAALTGYLADEALGWGSDGGGQAAAPADLLAQLEALSDDEAGRRLKILEGETR